MKITGLKQFYDVTDIDGRLKVWSGHSKREIPIFHGRNQRFYNLMTSDGKPRHFTAGCLRFLMMHPEIDARMIEGKKQRIKFSDDGKVVDLYDKPDGPYIWGKYSKFTDVDDALATVLVMKAGQMGDTEFIMRYIEEKREEALKNVASLAKIPYRVLNEIMDEAGELFLSQILTADCSRVRPFFAWYCRCIMETLQKRRKDISTHIKLVSIEAVGFEVTAGNAAWQPEFEIDNQ